MHSYKVRAQNLTAMGFLTQADHYKDFDIETDESLEQLATRLAARGFQDEGSKRWIMPGAIVWIEKYR